MDIKKLIIEEIGLSNSSYERLIEVTERFSLKKKDFLLQQGKVCTFIGFVEKGTLRSYTLIPQHFDLTLFISS